MNLAWGKFRNGKIPFNKMVVVRGEHFEPAAAAHLTLLEAAFQSVWGYPAIILEGYRSLTTQERLYTGWEKRLPGYNFAADPGTSIHGYGRAADFASHIDVYGTPQKDWMNAHAPAHGWHPAGDNFWPREAWHYEYWPGTATAGSIAEPIQKEIIAMATGMLHKAKGDATVYWQEKPATRLIAIDPATYSALKAVGVVIGDEITGAQLKQLIKDCGTATQPFGNAARGVAYRDESDGAIYAQTAPGGTLAHLSRAEWAAQEQNGLQYVNMTHKDIVTLLATK